MAEFAKLNTVTTMNGCLLAPETAIVEGIALDDAAFTVMADHNMSLVWSPRSNIFLYGGGVDLSKTTNVALARSKGINLALGTEWSIGGSQNLLDELRFAKTVDQAQWGSSLTTKDLVKMVTTNAARVLGLQNVLGSLQVGKKADVMIIAGDASAPYEALLAAKPADVRLVVVGGVALYGDPALQPLGPPSPGCESLSVCGRNKFICVATSTQGTSDKFDQTLPTISSELQTALQGYDAMALSQYRFAPLTPIVRCD
jgi:cytosine/adenosine deaminase-related metal-dependent hydrolase